jgi:hypothetical protein
VASDADFEAFIAKVRDFYGEMQNSENLSHQTTAHVADTVIAFEIFLNTIGKKVPETDVGNVLDATCGALSTMISSFAKAAARDDEADSESYYAYAALVIDMLRMNLFDRDPSKTTVTNIVGAAN